MKIKVLAILHLPPPDHGAGIMGEFIKKSSLINSSFEIDYVNLSTAVNFSDIGEINLHKIWTVLKLLVKLVIKLCTNRYQLAYFTINAQGPAWYKELILVGLLKLFKVPITFHYHNKGVATNAKTLFKKLLYRFQLKNTNTILLSPILYPDIAAFVAENEVFYCPNGIPDEREIWLKSSNFSGSVASNSIPQVLFLSNLLRSKGVYTLLEACQILKQRKLKFKCYLAGAVGDIETAELFGKIKEYDLTEEVKYLGKIYGNEKRKVLATVDILAFPTFYEKETFGLVNLEAMQFAKPVVSTYEGAIPDIVEDGKTGFLVPQRDAEALADKLEILFNNPELRNQMGAQGRIKYQEQFTLQVFENRLLTILKQLTKSE